MRRPVGLFLLAGITAMLAALVVYSALRQRELALERATAQTIQIVVAARPLPLGAKIEPGSVKLTRWSRDSVPPGSYTDTHAVAGTFVKSSFVENEPIVSAKLFTGEKTAGVMPLLIPPGMRAVSVPVDEVSDVAGFVQPHTRVDVVVAMANVGAEGKPFSKTVLENVEVLAIAQEIEGDKDKARVVKVVTLLVTPDEGERLALASREGGNLRLAIRNYEDSKIVLTRGSDIPGLLRVYSAAPDLPALRSQAISGRGPSKARRPSTMDVEIFRNGKSSESVSFIVGSADLSPPASATAPQKPVQRHRRVAGASDTAKARDGVKRVSGKAPVPQPVNHEENALDAAPGVKSAPAAYLPNPKTIDIP